MRFILFYLQKSFRSVAFKFRGIDEYASNFSNIWIALVIWILISNANYTENGNENRYGLTIGLPTDFLLVNARDSAIDPDWSENNRTLNSISCD